MADGYMTAMSMIRCSAGTVPLPIQLPVGHGVSSKNMALLNANDHIPMMNILPFGICRNKPPTPPGVNICVPVTPMAWRQGDTHCFVGGAPALTKKSCLTCMMGGTIKFM